MDVYATPERAERELPAIQRFLKGSGGTARLIGQTSWSTPAARRARLRSASRAAYEPGAETADGLIS